MQEDLVMVEYWVQDTMESGHWEHTAAIPRHIAEGLIYGDHGPALDGGVIIELERVKEL